MANCIITISREFGCGARDISRDLAARLGVRLYDKDLVDLAAEKAGVHVDVIREADEKKQKKQNRLFAEFGYGSGTSFYSDDAIQAQAQVIYEIAEKKENCIIFGRCADYFLRQYPNVLSFFLFAPLEYRIEHIAKGYGLDSGEALKLIKRVDRQRHNYYKYVTGHNRGDREGKDLLINVEKFGVEGSAAMMMDAFEKIDK